MSGWIKLHRKMLEWEWYEDTNTKVLYLHILLSANHKEKKWQGVTIEKGSFITGLESLSKKTGLSVRQVRTSLSKLISTGEVTSKTTNRFRIISIPNWDTYQQDDRPDDSQPTSKRQADDKQATATNNDKNVNKDNKGKDTKPDKPDQSAEIIEYLNKITNQNFRLVDSNMALIKQRLKSGASVDDIKLVIDKKVNDWRGTDMEKYLRPKTLFNATNFEQYIGEKPKHSIDQQSEYKGPRI